MIRRDRRRAFSSPQDVRVWSLPLPKVLLEVVLVRRRPGRWGSPRNWVPRTETPGWRPPCRRAGCRPDRRLSAGIVRRTGGGRAAHLRPAERTELPSLPSSSALPHVCLFSPGPRSRAFGARALRAFEGYLQDSRTNLPLRARERPSEGTGSALESLGPMPRRGSLSREASQPRASRPENLWLTANTESRSRAQGTHGLRARPTAPGCNRRPLHRTRSTGFPGGLVVQGRQFPMLRH